MPLRPEPELARLLDEADDPPPRGALTAIVGRHRARAQRRMRRTTAASLGVAVLSFGVAVGSVVSGSGGRSPVPSGGRTPTRPGVHRSASAEGAAASIPKTWSAAAAPSGEPKVSYAAGVVRPVGLTWATMSAAGAPGAVSGASAGGSLAAGPVTSGSLRRLFLRRHGGVALRAYVVGGSGSVSRVPGGGPSTSPSGAYARTSSSVCAYRSRLSVETSSTGAVGELSAPEVRAANEPIAAVAAGAVGVAENDAAELALVRAGSGVVRVVARFPSGVTDQMAVRSGWAVLVDHPVAARALGSGGEAFSLDAYGANGRLLERVAVPASGGIAVADSCFTPGAPGHQGDRR